MAQSDLVSWAHVDVHAIQGSLSSNTGQIDFLDACTFTAPGVADRMVVNHKKGE